MPDGLNALSLFSGVRSEESTSASNGPDTGSSDNAKPTLPPDVSSNGTGPESPSPTTSEPSTLTGCDVTAFAQNQRDEVRDLNGLAGALAAEPGMKQTTYVSISSVEASHARTCRSQENERDLPVNDQDCSSRQPESLTLFSDPEGGSSLRTFPDFFPQTADGISESFSRRWPTSGFTTSPGECWTADTSECPSGGGVFSSLPDVLEATVPSRFFLSPKAAAGILRRAEKRGKDLPPALGQALRARSEEETGATNLTGMERMSA